MWVARQLTSTTRALGRCGLYPVADLERLLEEQQQTRDDLADRILQGQAQNDEPIPRGGEQPADVGAPYVAKIIATPTAMIANRATSMKMAGIRPPAAVRGTVETVALTPTTP